MLKISKKLTEKENEEFKDNILKNRDAINETDASRVSLLQITIAQPDLDLAFFLINNGIDVNHQDSKGSTALHYCAEYNQSEIAKSLINNGAKLNIYDKFGNEPLWTATFNIRKDLSGLDMLELLLKNGADKNHTNNVKKSPRDLANEINFLPTIELYKKFD